MNQNVLLREISLVLIGSFVFGPFLLKKGEVVKELPQVDNYACDALPMYLALADTI